MSGPKIFILPEELQKWMETAGVKIVNNAVTLPELPSPYKLEAALFFRKLVAGGEDPGTMVGKIKTMSSIQQSGFELFQNSVIVGDNAYEVDEGFLLSWDEGFAARDAQGAPEKDAAPGDSKTASAKEKETPEDLLARLLMEKLK
jgi:hypothetical protein